MTMKIIMYEGITKGIKTLVGKDSSPWSHPPKGFTNICDNRS